MSILCYAFLLKVAPLLDTNKKTKDHLLDIFFSVDVVHIDDEMMHTACVDCS